MKKKILMGLLTVAMCFTLVSCSENEATNNLSSNNNDIPTTTNNNSKKICQIIILNIEFFCKSFL